MKRNLIAIISLIMCSNVFADSLEPNYDEIFYTRNEKGVVVAKVNQTIHFKDKIWYLKQVFDYVESDKESVVYQCFNGYPYSPYLNKNKTWAVTDSKLSGCEKIRQELTKK
ncbi:hypothetical protein LCA30_02225 [Vibrio harveyi]|uniref:hypothetical protein n=1 Tax=Vibrio harveyi TaxID=669 RepID=UPI003BB67BDB